MAKGANAKVEVIKKISEAFGSDFIGEVDKKVYVWANDGGERVQIALALTCPKTFIDAVDNNPVEKKEDFDWSSDTVVTKPKPVQKAEITQEEQDRILTLVAQLGL